MNNMGLVDLEKLRKQKNKCDFRGKSAYCFVDGNKIIKVYASEHDHGFITLDRKNIVDFSKYISDTIVFPDKYLYDKGMKAGEVMDYIKNDIISSSLNDKLNIRKLIDNYEVATFDIYTYSNIIMCDLCSVNILYSENNGFHIIDTTEWELNKKNNNSFNMNRFNAYILKALLTYLDIDVLYEYSNTVLDKDFKKNILKYGSQGKELCHILEYNINSKYDILSLIYAYMAIYQKYYNKELNTLGNIKEMTKMLKKG